eukprot:689478-Prymnesium_polylepis.1
MASCAEAKASSCGGGGGGQGGGGSGDGSPGAAPAVSLLSLQRVSHASEPVSQRTSPGRRQSARRLSLRRKSDDTTRSPGSQHVPRCSFTALMTPHRR